MSPLLPLLVLWVFLGMAFLAQIHAHGRSIV